MDLVGEHLFPMNRGTRCSRDELAMSDKPQGTLDSSLGADEDGCSSGRDQTSKMFVVSVQSVKNDVFRCVHSQLSGSIDVSLTGVSSTQCPPRASLMLRFSW
jgi:hypothetical protein